MKPQGYESNILYTQEDSDSDSFDDTVNGSDEEITPLTEIAHTEDNTIRGMLSPPPEEWVRESNNAQGSAGTVVPGYCNNARVRAGTVVPVYTAEATNDVGLEDLTRRIKLLNQGLELPKRTQEDTMLDVVSEVQGVHAETSEPGTSTLLWTDRDGLAGKVDIEGSRTLADLKNMVGAPEGRLRDCGHGCTRISTRTRVAKFSGRG